MSQSPPSSGERPNAVVEWTCSLNPMTDPLQNEPHFVMTMGYAILCYPPPFSCPSISRLQMEKSFLPNKQGCRGWQRKETSGPIPHGYIFVFITRFIHPGVSQMLQGMRFASPCFFPFYWPVTPIQSFISEKLFFRLLHYSVEARLSKNKYWTMKFSGHHHTYEHTPSYTLVYSLSPYAWSDFTLGAHAQRGYSS